MPERFNFVTSNMEDLAKAEDLMIDAEAFAVCLTLNKYQGFDGTERYFISGQAIEEDSNAAPLDLRICFETEGVTVAWLNDGDVGRIPSTGRLFD